MKKDNVLKYLEVSFFTKVMLAIVIALVSVFFYYGITVFIFGEDFWLLSLVGDKK